MLFERSMNGEKKKTKKINNIRLEMIFFLSVHEHVSYKSFTNLIDQRSLVRITLQQYFGPKIRISTSYQISRFAFEKTILIAYAY